MTLSHLQSQDADKAYAVKVKTLDSTLETLYSVISGDAGVKRDWDLFRYLFRNDARLIPTRKNNAGEIITRYMTPDEYIESSGNWVETNGFFEKEIHREVDSFGTLSQVFSTYESYRSMSDKEPLARGINSIQMLNDGNRWWIINIYWASESEANPLPEKYLPGR